MEEMESRAIQQTPPPSPYLETTWDLPLEKVHHGLLHPKEKRVGYLELYFAGFMEFVEEPPSPEMSDDETEYPRWGRVTTTRDQPPSSVTTERPDNIETSLFSDAMEPEIPMLSRRTATASSDSTGFEGYESSLTDLPPNALSEKTTSIRCQRQKSTFRRSNSTGQGRFPKASRSYSTRRARSMGINNRPMLRTRATSSRRKHSNLKGR